MGPARPQVSDAERDVLKALWDLGPATVRRLRTCLAKQGRDWAHTTISTLLTRMAEKGLVLRDTSVFAHVYSAALSRESLMQQHLSDLADEYCDGQSVPLMLALVEGRQFAGDEIEQFRQLIDQLSDRRSEAPTVSKRSKKHSSE
jgi:BlaI family penicillinase repressor